MIKITHLLKESFTTYRLNFKKIFWISLPILILGIISEYYSSIFTTMIDNDDFSNISYMILSFAIYIITVFIVSLYFGPVLNRAIQKKEDNGVFDTNSAYAFQKKNIFKWIMVNIWGFLYMVWVMLPYIAIATLVAIIPYAYNDSSLILIIVSSLIGLTLLIGIVLNITKFVLFKNVFFSKDDVSARDAVRESIELGKTKKSQIWILILILIISTIAIMVTFFVLGYMIGLIANLVPENIILYSQIILSGLISVLFFLPVMSIITAKGYVKIRG